MTIYLRNQGFWLLHSFGVKAVGFVNYGAQTITESEMLILPPNYWGES